MSGRHGQSVPLCDAEIQAIDNLDRALGASENRDYAAAHIAASFAWEFYKTATLSRKIFFLERAIMIYGYFNPMAVSGFAQLLAELRKTSHHHA